MINYFAKLTQSYLIENVDKSKIIHLPQGTIVRINENEQRRSYINFLNPQNRQYTRDNMVPWGSLEYLELNDKDTIRKRENISDTLERLNTEEFPKSIENTLKTIPK